MNITLTFYEVFFFIQYNDRVIGPDLGWRAPREMPGVRAPPGGVLLYTEICPRIMNLNFLSL